MTMGSAKKSTGKQDIGHTRQRREQVRTENPFPDFIGTETVAEICGIVPKTVWHRVWEGSMPEPVRVGRTLLWRRSVIEEWAKERRRRGRPRKGAAGGAL